MNKHKHKSTAHLSLEFPCDQHLYLKMICAKNRWSIKDFVINAVTKSIREYDEKVLEGIDAGLEDIKSGKVIYRNASEFEKYADE